MGANAAQCIMRVTDTAQLLQWKKLLASLFPPPKLWLHQLELEFTES